MTKQSYSIQIKENCILFKVKLNYQIFVLNFKAKQQIFQPFCHKIPQLLFSNSELESKDLAIEEVKMSQERYRKSRLE